LKKHLLLFTTFIFITAVSYGQLLNDTVVDFDGNIYHTIKIGTQTWMLENLNVTHYRNGDIVPNVTDSLLWGKLKTGAYCNYNNDTNVAKTYGRLYNFYSVMDSRNLCPLNWHVPSDAEWKILEKYLDNTLDTTLETDYKNTIGGKLKETGTMHWRSPNKGATNSSAFNALPGGFRNTSPADFLNMIYNGYWWSSTVFNYILVRGRYIKWESSFISECGGFFEQGQSVRCLKD
jgi:uncharacterized protein (TIGR02145 family)